MFARRLAVGANWMGKVKACMQSITIAVGLAMPRIMHEVSSRGMDADWVTRPFTALVIGTMFSGLSEEETSHSG